MDPATKAMLPKYSKCASGLRSSIGKTPLERMLQVEKLSQLGQLVRKLAGKKRVVSSRPR